MQKSCVDTYAPFSEQIRKHMTNNTDAILCVSPLVRLEALVKPTIDGDIALIADYWRYLMSRVGEIVRLVG